MNHKVVYEMEKHDRHDISLCNSHKGTVNVAFDDTACQKIMYWNLNAFSVYIIKVYRTYKKRRECVFTIM